MIIIHFKALKKKTSSKFSKVAYIAYLQNFIRYYTFCYYQCNKLFGFNKTKICRARLFPNPKKTLTILLYYYTYLQRVFHTNRLIL